MFKACGVDHYYGLRQCGGRKDLFHIQLHEIEVP